MKRNFQDPQMSDTFMYFRYNENPYKNTFLRKFEKRSFTQPAYQLKAIFIQKENS